MSPSQNVATAATAIALVLAAAMPACADELYQYQYTGSDGVGTMTIDATITVDPTNDVASGGSGTFSATDLGFNGDSLSLVTLSTPGAIDWGCCGNTGGELVGFKGGGSSFTSDNVFTPMDSDWGVGWLDTTSLLGYTIDQWNDVPGYTIGWLTGNGPGSTYYGSYTVTDIGPSVVREASSLAVLGSGLLCLIWFARKRTLKCTSSSD